MEKRKLQKIIVVILMIAITEIIVYFSPTAVHTAAETAAYSANDNNEAIDVDTVPTTEMQEENSDVMLVAEIEESAIPEFVFEEKVPFVPTYYQADYASTYYGSYGTVASHGCGITSLAMALSYLMDEKIMPDTLAKEYGHFNTKHGSSYSLFFQSASDYGIEVTQTYNWDDVIKALEEGHLVIATPHKNIFTDGGHFILLCGLTFDGRVKVKDPNKYNYYAYNKWCGDTRKEGFSRGFEQKYLQYSCFPCWIYPLKDIDTLERDALYEYYDQYYRS